MNTTPENFIVKVQRPLTTNVPGGYNTVLVYSEDRSVRQELDIDMVPKFAPNEFKYFAFASLSLKDNNPEHLTVSERAPWQKW